MSSFNKKARLNFVAKTLIVIFVFVISSYIMIPNTTVVAYADSTVTTSNKKSIENKILTDVLDYKTEITFTSEEVNNWGIVKDTETDPGNVYYELLFDHPEIFWTSLKISWVKYDDGSYILYINNLYDNSVIDSKRLEVQNKINEITNQFSSYDDLRKAYEIHDYITKNCTYDTDNVDKSMPSTTIDPKVDFDGYIADDKAIAKANASYFEEHSIYGVLINGRAVCEGYAKCAKILFNKSGIESEVIRSNEHGWNYVKINGNYYQMDITYDDSNDEATISPYEYFNITNSEMAHDKDNIKLHTAISGNVPTCTDDTFDKIFRNVSSGTLRGKNVVRANDRLYGIEPNGSKYNLYSCNLDGTNKTEIKSDIYDIDNVYAYNNKIYYFEYGLKDDELYMDINKYDISTGKTIQSIDLLSEFGQPKGDFYVCFYIKNNIMYVTLKDDNGEITKNYKVLS